MIFKCHQRHLCFYACVLAVLPAKSFAAEKVKALSEGNIRAFVQETSRLTSGRASDRSGEQITEYLQDHLHDDSRFKSLIRYNIPGYEAQETAMSFSKDEFISNVNAGVKAVDDYATKVDILDVKISSDKKKATVQTRSNESATMPVQGDNGETEQVPLEGVSLCTQLITLSNKGVIQMFSANCTTDVEFIE